MFGLLIALSLLTGACSAQAVDGGENAMASRLIVVPSRIDPDTVGLGYCGSDANSVDLTRIIIHERRWLDVFSAHGRTRVRVQGESVAFVRLEGDQRTTSFNLGDILDGESGIDIELRIASVENQLAVYWRETFQHRIYRQGLLRIAEEGLLPWCEGRGGISSDPGIAERTTLE